MSTNATIPNAIFLKDYQQPSFAIPQVELFFDLHEDFARIHSKLNITPNHLNAMAPAGPLILNGENMELESVHIDGRVLNKSEYTISDSHLTIEHVPSAAFVLETVVKTEPQKNLSCEGLYRSTGMFCTQCEAESFRRITYFLDRPDVMSTYTVKIEADKSKYPLLLSNGNRLSQRDLENGRHQVIWQDPHKKPCYLFALVAGDLGKISEPFITRSGREVQLEVYSNKGQEERCRHAMKSLQLAMKWDEETYGLEYDLDIYMIVAAEDFNMGAMENKGLNVFNSSYVLAQPETATDNDYAGILSVVGHEYFHNWTGNRVTCRDWFQLSLKEGLTVFRDQRFSADITSAAVNRIEEVVRLRTQQFAEDSGPMAHPIRPQSYIAINNFYTLTVYEKGAEVIRMIQTIVGRDGFRKGMDLYFKRHDGQAVRTDDFVAAMADANNTDLTQFKNWYDLAGTPTIAVTTHFDQVQQTYTVNVEQKSPALKHLHQADKLFHIPVSIGLIGTNGMDLPIETNLLHVRERQQSFVFKGIKERPVLSLLRDFSAPVKVEYNYSDADLAFLMAHDSDSVARWDAAQTLAVRSVKSVVEAILAGQELPVPEHLVTAFGPAISDQLSAKPTLDPAFVSFLLTLPAEEYLAQFFKVVDVDAIHAAREHILKLIAQTYKTQLAKLYECIAKEAGEKVWPHGQGERALKNRALSFLTLFEEASGAGNTNGTDDSGKGKYLELALAQLRGAKNMTDEMGALIALNPTSSPLRRLALDEFYSRWHSESLVMNKWFALQATAPHANALDEVIRLSELPLFDKMNPNKIYSLQVAFSRNNLVQFHNKSGAAYRYIADQVLEIDSRNPQVASRVVTAFNQWRSLDQARQQLIKRELERIVATPGLSNNVFEIASKALNMES
jgi:aminopeptidase N